MFFEKATRIQLSAVLLAYEVSTAFPTNYLNIKIYQNVLKKR